MNEHPITLERAKELVAGKLGDVYRGILMSCCAPIYWFRVDTAEMEIAHNGTLTIVKTPQELLGITAAHVFRQYESDMQHGKFRLQVMNEVIDDLRDRLIDVSDKFDLATFRLEPELVQRMGKTPLGEWPPRPPEEGKGIMIAGYPALERREFAERNVDFGLFTVLGSARVVTDLQITWLLERECQLRDTTIPTPPPAYDLGGVSGGPLISWFESESFVTHFCLSGIVVEHPDYRGNRDMPAIERLIAVRADAMSESGRLAIN